MRLNLHSLRVFHTVALEGNFSAAARALHISQPAVSKAVSQLERQLDMALIERMGRKPSQGLRLTEAGEALHAHARAIFALEHAAVSELQQRSGLKQGRLVIGASTTIASYWLPGYLHAFASAWPEITLQVVVANTQSIAEELFDCRLDTALVEGPVHVDGISAIPWNKERLVIVGPPSFGAGDNGPDGTSRHDTGMSQSAVRMSVEALTGCTWLLREAGSGTREVTFDLLARQGMQLRRSVQIGSNEGIARAVASGLGVAMLPFAVVEDLLSLGRLVELSVPTMTGLTRQLYRLKRVDRPVSPAVQAFLGTLKRPLERVGLDPQG